MVNPIKDYEQNKMHSSTRQTVIVDETKTGETDELDPKFDDAEDPEQQPDSNRPDGEETNDSQTAAIDEVGLNHGTQDDLSLNIPEDDIL